MHCLQIGCVYKLGNPYTDAHSDSDTDCNTYCHANSDSDTGSVHGACDDD
jgi:hypothetical protein